MKERNLYLDFIKFPMALLVIYAHVPGRPELQLEPESLYYSLLTFICYIPKYLTGIAMRSFFVISGYLFYKNFIKWDFNLFWDKFKKRCRILVPSYFLWITLYVILICVIYHKNPFDYFSEKGMMNVYLGFDNIKTMMTKCYPLLYPMWYVRDLLVAFAISPVLYGLLKKSPLGILLIYILYWLIPIPTEAFFFVGVGIFLALYGNQINRNSLLFSRVNIIISVLAVVLVFFCNLIKCDWIVWHLIDKCGFFSNIITMWAFYLISRNLDNSKFAKFGRCSYFIFAFHPFLIELFLKVHYTRLSLMSVDLTIPYAFLYLLFPIFIYCIGYYIDKTIKKYSPILTRLLCAG